MKHYPWALTAMLGAWGVFAWIVWSPQQPTVTLTQSPTGLSVAWTSSPAHPLNEWIGLYKPGTPTEVFPTSLFWKFVPAGGMGELTFQIPGTGEWEARYLSGSNATLATSPRLMIAIDDPPPGDPLPPVQQTRRITRVRIVRANGAVELREPQENTNYANPAQAVLELVTPELLDGDEAFVDEWSEPVVLPTRTPDRIWRVRVNKAIP